jgi:hypothetical protein
LPLSERYSVYLNFVRHEALKIKIYFSETLVSTYRSSWRHNPEEHHRRRLRRCENFKSHKKREDALFATNKISNAVAISFSTKKAKHSPVGTGSLRYKHRISHHQMFYR